MKRETISKGVGNISDRYVIEAAIYVPIRKQYGSLRGAFVKSMAAAVIVMCVLCAFVCGAIFLFSTRDDMVTVYAYGTDEEITAAGAVMGTGTISDTGEMKGKPLMFYLTGKDIATVRFSCKNQMICFTDWTEKRDGYGNARNFSVTYGGDESEYYYLTVDWVPNDTIRELTDNADSSIASLPDELREDIIVMEITFGNGKTVTKAVTVFLQDDGTFFARFDDYKIKDSNDFVNRPDSEAVPENDDLTREAENVDLEVEGNVNSATEENVDSEAEENGDSQAADEESKEQKNAKQENTLVNREEEQIEAAKQAALAYYEGTVFSVNSIEYFEGKLSHGNNECYYNFTVNVSKDGVVQEPDRTISLQLDQDGWKVVNEGY